jgi:deoxyribonuclease (pyrimidine dimer)
MTRINAGVNPTELHRRHLIAEYRETLMVPAALRRSLRTRNIDAIIAGIPKTFTLNKGHVSFFFDKLKYLETRYESLKQEMRNRGYFVADTRTQNFEGFPTVLYNDWTPTSTSRTLILSRINERKLQKPWLYEKD